MSPQVPRPIAHSDYIHAADGHFEILPKLSYYFVCLKHSSLHQPASNNFFNHVTISEINMTELRFTRNISRRICV